MPALYFAPDSSSSWLNKMQPLSDYLKSPSSFVNPTDESGGAVCISFVFPLPENELYTFLAKGDPIAHLPNGDCIPAGPSVDNSKSEYRKFDSLMWKFMPFSAFSVSGSAMLICTVKAGYSRDPFQFSQKITVGFGARVYYTNLQYIYMYQFFVRFLFIQVLM